MINNFCICTLTHSVPGRDLALRHTIKSIMDNYSADKFEWFIWVNITDAGIDEVLDWAVQTYSDKVQFNITKSEYNLGPGGGINRLNELSKEYEYSFFIEGDWINVPNKISGVSSHWIQNSIKLLESRPELDQIQFRRYLDDADHRMYYFGWIEEKNVEGTTSMGDMFYLLKKLRYVNTPSLRRMSRFYEKGVFPLKEFIEEGRDSKEVKGNPEWGKAEIDAMNVPLNGAWIQYGNFIHFEDWPYVDDWSTYLSDKKGCGQFKTRGDVRCKYGFMVPSPVFCTLCKKEKGITDLLRHAQHFEEVIREIDQMPHKDTISDVELIDYMQSKNDDLVINVKSYLDQLQPNEHIRKNWRGPNK